MGYTHYWHGNERRIQANPWSKFTLACSDIITLATTRGVGILPVRIPLNEIVISENTVEFNGMGEQGLELFEFTRTIPKFTFCKTARLPYDSVVTACLVAAHQILGANRIVVSSDGKAQDWLEGETLYREATGDVSPILSFPPYSERRRA
jgi:hypothetical protein